MVSDIASQWEDPGFRPCFVMGAFCVEIVCYFCVGGDFQFPHSQKQHMLGSFQKPQNGILWQNVNKITYIWKRKFIELGNDVFGICESLFNKHQDWCVRVTKYFLSALKIHISQSTAEILMKIGSYELEERGDTELKVYCITLFKRLCVCIHEIHVGVFTKGKGLQKTFWLNSKDGLTFPLTPQHYDVKPHPEPLVGVMFNHSCNVSVCHLHSV